MKKAIVLSVLGLATSGLAAFGQGVINFNNYGTANYNSDQVIMGATGLPATPGDGVTVQLLYSLGDISGGSTSAFLATATAGITATINGTNPSGSYGVGPYGYYNGGNQIINGWSTGPVTFAVEAWVGTDYASAVTKGISALFTATDAVGNGPGIVSSSLPSHTFATMPGVTLAVPEPTTMAFAGMGLLSLLSFARRKKV